MSWQTIIGQDRVKTILRRSFDTDRIAHAYLFYGPEGVGKDAAAIEFAKLLNCLDAKTPEPCDSCTNCKRITALQHPNLRYIIPLPLGKSEKEGDDPLKGLDEKTIQEYRRVIREKAEDPYRKISLERANTIKISSIREIRRSLLLASAEAGKKVVIVSEADKMNDYSANALLKTLEEPAPNTVIILTTSFRDRLLSTIISRCQAVRFEILRDDEIRSELLRRNPGLDVRQAEMIAKMSNGNFSRATELLSADLLQQRDEILDLLRMIVARPPSVWVKEIESIAYGGNRQDIEQSLLLLNLWLRDAMLLRESNDEAILNIDQHEPLRKFNTHFTDADLPRVIGAVEKSIALVRKNIYLSLILMDLAFELRSLILRH